MSHQDDLIQSTYQNEHGSRITSGLRTYRIGDLVRTRFQREIAFTICAGLLLAVVIPLSQEIPFLIPIRLILGVGFILFLPGYWLSAVLFPFQDDLDVAQRTVVAFGLSLSVVALIVLVLNNLPWGIRLVPALVAYALFFTICLPAAWGRRRLLVAGRHYASSFPQIDFGGWWSSQGRANKVIFLILALSFLVTIIIAASIILTPRSAEFLTEFYIVGPDKNAENYPWRSKAGQPVTVQLGITNHERESRAYQVSVQDGSNTIGTAGPFELAPGKNIEQTLTFTPETTGEDVQVDILLYDDKQSKPYRTLRLWLTVTSP